MDFVQAEHPSLHVVEIHPGQVTETEMAGKLEGLGHIDDGIYNPSLPRTTILTASS